eukprot:TRINITY_DN58_c0_g1_i1.p1 TRINITY_DN58_c0_g1~~TRINITY_DN58_c0_g1_i1.p1  ORF type:complete len:485 (-),score=124.41 TRINITY_DN58_c0_g1_i1:32-1486(-)
MDNSLVSLYVSNLDETVTEGTLYELFKNYGEAVSFRVVRDDENKSLGYAYVNFTEKEDAERAIAGLDGQEINGKVCSVSHQKRRSGKNTIFVSNIPEGTTNDQVTEIFSQFGSITSLKIFPSAVGGNLQGYVEFESEEEMKGALEADTIKLNGQNLYVAQFISKDKREKIKETSWTNIFVKNLPGSTTLDELNALFEPYGTIVASVVKPIDIESGVRCYGHVNFEKHEDAVKAVDELNESIYQGDPIYCSRAGKKTDRKNSKFSNSGNNFYGRNLFVKNIDFFFTEEDLLKEFSQYGNVTSVKIATDEMGSKGFGYVCFQTEEEARAAIQDKHINRFIPGGTKPLHVALHEPRDMRMKRLLRGDLSFVPPGPESPVPVPVPVWGGYPPHYYNAPQPTPQSDLHALVSTLQPRQLQESPKDGLRQTLGNIIYPVIHQHQPTYSTKIVGMFLDWPVSQIYEVFTKPEIFNEALQSATQALLNQQNQ